MPKNANRALPVPFRRFKTRFGKRALKSNFLKGKISFKICLKKKKETEKKQREVEKRTKIGRKVEIMNIRYHAIASIRMKTSKSVGGITCSGRTIPFRFLAEYGRL